jgi:hypothetical protein
MTDTTVHNTILQKRNKTISINHTADPESILTQRKIFTPDRSIMALGMELISVAVLGLPSATSTGMTVWLVTSSYTAQNLLFAH